MKKAPAYDGAFFHARAPAPPILEPGLSVTGRTYSQAVSPEPTQLWSRREEERLRQEVAEGLPLDVIAYRHDRSVGAIRDRIRKLDGPNPSVESLPQRRESRGVPQSHTRWTGEEDDQIREAYSAGEVIAEIAKRHGRTEVAIVSRLGRLGCIDPDAWRSLQDAPANPGGAPS